MLKLSCTVGCVVLLFFGPFLVSGATITWKYDYNTMSTGGTFEWTDTTYWDPAQVPGPTDSVVIEGCSGCRGSQAAIIVLNVADPVAISSLTFKAQDIVLALGPEFNVTTLMFQGGEIRGGTLNILTSGTFSQDYTSKCSFYGDVHIVNNPSSVVTYTNLNCFTVGTTVTNYGTWNWGTGMNYFYSQANSKDGNSFVNYGMMGFTATSKTSTFSIYADITNYGTLSFHTGEVMSGTNNPGALVGEPPVLNNNGVINIDADGTLYFFSAATINLNSGSTYTGMGPLSLVCGQADVPIIVNLNADVHIPNLYTQAYVTIQGTGTMTADAWETQGSLLTGSTNYVIKNFSTNAPENYLTADNLKFQRTITVTGWYTCKLSPLLGPTGDFTHGANLVISLGATLVSPFCLLDSSDNSGKIINNGTMQGSLSVGFSDFWLSIDNYGTIALIDETPGQYNQFWFNKGGNHYGTISIPDKPFEDDETPQLYLRGVHKFYEGSTITGGFISSSGGPGCNSLNAIGCAGPFIVFDAATFTVPAYYQTFLGTMGVDTGKTITVDNAVLGGGIISGGGDLTFKSGKFITDEPIIDTINLKLNGNFELDQSVVFRNNGKITISATSHVNYTRYNTDAATGDAGFYNNGRVTFKKSGFDSHQMDGNFFNNGVIDFYFERDENSDPYGLEMTWNGLFVQTATAITRLRIFSSTDYDALLIFPESLACSFSGNIAIEFLFTPTVGSTFDILTYQKKVLSSYTECSGKFITSATGLSAGTDVNIVYDIAPSGTAALYGRLVVCDSSNSTCMASHQAGNPTVTTTTSTTSESGSGGTTGSGGSGGTTSGSGGTSSSASCTHLYGFWVVAVLMSFYLLGV